MTEKEKALFGCLGMLITFPVAISLGWMAEGYAARQLWEWYISPTFGLPLLTIPQALGLAFLWSLFSPTPQQTEEKDPTAGKIIAKILGNALFKPAFALLAGWIVYRWM